MSYISFSKRTMQRKKMHQRKGNPLRRGIAIAIVTSQFNADITANMQKGAVSELRATGINKNKIEIVEVPGSFELPLACQRLAQSGKYDGLIAIGCVIKGETDHYRHIARETARGIMEVMLKYTIPIGLSVITVDTVEQALTRSTKHNKGQEAARAVLETLSTFSSE